MILERWVVSLSKYKKLTLKIADYLIDRINLEPIEGDNENLGVKAAWVGEPGKNRIEINARSLKGNIRIEGDRAPKIEYWQKGDKRGIALENPKNVSCELDEKTLRKILTPKAAGIAMVAGAAIGLAGCHLLSGKRRYLHLRQPILGRPVKTVKLPKKHNSHLTASNPRKYFAMRGRRDYASCLIPYQLGS